MAKCLMTWRDGPPPRRGVFRVRSAYSSPNSGYRYHYGGGRWSNLRHKFSHAQELGHFPEANRNTPITKPVQWWGPML